jgi:hypothetical protein
MDLIMMALVLLFGQKPICPTCVRSDIMCVFETRREIDRYVLSVKR